MCGIFGVVAAQVRDAVDRDAASRCAAMLAHRGPDAAGTKSGAGFCFSHRRLSILDPDTRSDQPFQDSRAQVTLTYNGEIYNFRKLREHLQSLGAPFRTQSDTEVVLQAYLHWGIECVQRFEGIFAFAIHDAKTGETFLARDRIGVKPLYYTATPRSLIFASDVSSILAYPGVRKQVNLQAVSSYLSYRTVLGDRSLFAGIHKLLPGYYLSYKQGRFSLVRYWNVNLADEIAFDADELRDLVAHSVSAQLVADVPVAVLLSGGLDSSILTLEMAKAHPSTVVCFTAAAPGQRYDESLYAAAVARHVHAQHRIVPVTLPSDPEDILDFVRKRSQPLAMHNEIAMFQLAREIGRSHKVVLMGEGADELFAGYGRIYRLPFDRRRARIVSALPAPARSALARHLQVIDFAPDDLAFFLARYTYFAQSEKFSLLHPDVRPALAQDRWITALFEDHLVDAGNCSLFDRISYLFLKVHLPALLDMVDAATMAFGVEGRVPFTDHRLVQYAMSLPQSAKLRWKSLCGFLKACGQPIEQFSEKADDTKYALRAAYRSRLPSSVTHRTKMGFPLPLGQWAVSAQSAALRDVAFSPQARSAGLFDTDALIRWYRRHAAAPTDDFGKKVWLICNLELFLRHHFDHGAVYA